MYQGVKSDGDGDQGRGGAGVRGPRRKPHRKCVAGEGNFRVSATKDKVLQAYINNKTTRNVYLLLLFEFFLTFQQVHGAAGRQLRVDGASRRRGSEQEGGGWQEQGVGVGTNGGAVRRGGVCVVRGGAE